MALTISGTSNGKLGNLSLSANTGDILDSANTSFFGADTWYLNTNHTTNADITAWTRWTGDGGGNIGTAMSVSSGVFTFPTTGVWLILGTFAISNTTTSDDDSYILLKSSSDNFSTTNTNYALTNRLNIVSGRGFVVASSTFMFDCTDTSNDKVKWEAASFSTGNKIEGFVSGNSYRSWVHFVRLGDT